MQGFGLLCSDPSRFDLRDRIILTTNWRAGNPAQHSYLTNVSERIGNRPLKQSLARRVKLVVRGKVLIKKPKRRVKSRDLSWPRSLWRILPGLNAFRDR